MREIDAIEFREWQELYDFAPWGDDWAQTGLMVATSINLWSKKKYKPEQFIPGRRVPRRKSPEQMEAELMLYARLHNAAIERREGKK